MADSRNNPTVQPFSESAQSLEMPVGQIGPYYLLNPIGSGGMGEVYKAERREPMYQVVAIKIIKLGLDTREVIARFESERQALAMMDHPNIARVFDAGTTSNGRPYFVMEFVSGEPITAYCDRYRLTTEDRMRLFSQVCSAIQHAHQKGIIHRDLKPNNILISAQHDKPIVKVIDFGIAKATAQRLIDSTLVTEAGQFLGTPEYISPEQAEMSGLDVDTRSDIYSLGVILYELLSGSLPFDSKTLRAAGYEAIRQIIREVDPPKPSTRLSSMNASIASEIAQRRRIDVTELSRNLKRELEWIPLKAMHKDRTRRYRTAIELADDIENYLNRRPLIAAPDSLGYRTAKLIRRNRGKFIAATLVVLSLIAGAIGTGVGLVRESKQRAIAMQQMKLAEQNAEEARRQMNVAKAVSQFQTEMLAFADPKKAMGEKITVAQAMQSAEKMLDEGQLSDQPMAASTVRQTIGYTYLGLGLLEPAKRNLEKTLSLRKSIAGLDPTAVAESMSDLGEVTRKQGDYATSESMYRGALEIDQKARQPNDPGIAADLNNLALLYTDAAKLDQAAACYVQALAIEKTARPPDSPDILTMLQNYALLLKEQRKFDEAIAIFNDVIAAQRRTLPAGDPDVGLSLINLAATELDANRLEPGLAHAKEALAIFQKVFPPEHPLISNAKNNIGAALVRLNRLEEAEPMLRQVYDVYKKTLPPGHKDLAGIESAYGRALQLQKKNEQAEPLLRDALVIQTSIYGANSPRVNRTALALYQLLKATNREAEASAIEAKYHVSAQSATSTAPAK